MVKIAKKKIGDKILYMAPMSLTISRTPSIIKSLPDYARGFRKAVADTAASAAAAGAGGGAIENDGHIHDEHEAAAPGSRKVERPT